MILYDNIRIPWPDWYITDELGEGGYGKVYKIERTRSGISGTAALKVISIPKSKTEYDDVRFTLDTDEEAEEYFTRKKERILGEIKTMQNLKGCSNIVSIDDWIDLKKESGPGWDIYIRMELLTPFKEWFTAKEATDNEVIKLGIDICTALMQCAKEGVIHRDIKPENILVSKHGDFKLADFGIARELDHTTYVSRSGTPPYMSPEIYNGEEAGRTVDMYSLGLVMYELLNDRRLPFVPKNYSPRDLQAAVQERVNGEKIPEPVNGSPGLKKIVLKACEHDPRDRYKTAGKMKVALEKLQRQTDEAEETVSGRSERSRKSRNVKSNHKSDGNKWSDLSETVGADTGPGSKKKTAKTDNTVIIDDDFRPVSGKKDDTGSWKKAVIILGAVLVIAVIALTVFYGGTGKSKSNNAYAGIRFSLPSDWDEDTEYHEEMLAEEKLVRCWNPAGDTDASLTVECVSRDSGLFYITFFDEGLEAFVDDACPYTGSTDDLINKGYLEIDGTECFQIEYITHDPDEDIDRYIMYIPSEDRKQVAVVCFSYVAGKKADYEIKENESAGDYKKCRKHIIDSISLSGETEDTSELLDYEQIMQSSQKYVCEGIEIFLPEEWELNRDEDNIKNNRWIWVAPDWSDLSVLVTRIDDKYKKGIEGTVEESYRFDKGIEGNTVNKGTITIDGTEAYYVEVTHSNEGREFYTYELYIPLSDKTQIAEMMIRYSANGRFADRDKDIQNRILSSLKIEE